MSFITTLRIIYRHPLNKLFKDKIKSYIRYIRWHISFITNQYPIIYSFTGKTRLIIKKGMSDAVGNLFYGLQEYEDMLFLLHFLREEDFFVDVGANIGSFTILASGHVGSRTMSFEPVPQTYQSLLDNIAINRLEDKVSVKNLALGSEKGNVKFTNILFGAINHVCTNEETDDSIEVPTDTLDNILQDEKVPLLIKIDVEGFETEVINGAIDTLKKDGLKAIIIELNGSGIRYGYDDAKIHDFIISLGFKAYRYDPELRKLYLIERFGSHNTIYIRDYGFVEGRVNSAPKVNIQKHEI